MEEDAATHGGRDCAARAGIAPSGDCTCRERLEGRSPDRSNVRVLTLFNRYAEGIYSISPEPEPSSPTHVALLVDYPVLLRAIRATDPDAVPRLGDIVRRAGTLGSVFVSRAYGAWYDVDEATAAFSEGLDPVYVPPAGPGNVPTTSALVADGLALSQSGQIHALALCGDDRLLPLVAAAHAEGIPVALIAHSCLPDGPCLKLATSAEPAAAFARLMTRAERYRRPTSAA